MAQADIDERRPTDRFSPAPVLPPAQYDARCLRVPSAPGAVLSDLAQNPPVVRTVLAGLMLSIFLSADLRQARRPLRPPPSDALRHRRVHRRLAALRARAEHGPTGAGASAAGDRRGRADGGEPGDHRRHRPAARARPLPGLLQQHVRHRQRRRPGARGPAHRVPVVALGILDQPADRPSRAGHLAANPGRPAGAAPATGDRLPGHRADGGGPHRAAPGHHPDRPGRSLERPGAARPVRPGGARPAAVRRPGAALPRTAGADATVRRPRRHPQLAGCVLRQLPSR